PIQLPDPPAHYTLRLSNSPSLRPAYLPFHGIPNKDKDVSPDFPRCLLSSVKMRCRPDHPLPFPSPSLLPLEKHPRRRRYDRSWNLPLFYGASLRSWGPGSPLHKG